MPAQATITFSATPELKELISRWRRDHREFNLSRLLTAYLEHHFGSGKTAGEDRLDPNIEGVQAMLTEDRLEELRVGYRAEVESGRAQGHAIGAALAGTLDFAPLELARGYAKERRLRDALWEGKVDGRPRTDAAGDDALDLAINRRGQETGLPVTTVYRRALELGFERAVIDYYEAALERIATPEYEGPAPSFFRDDVRAALTDDTSEYVIGEPVELNIDWNATRRRHASEDRSDPDHDPFDGQ
jgi:hypothetical protein